ncbi:pyridoxamine 5'-phosphate oxidase family protein [Streptomyces lancefieldiae]|uniref:Pyridoxamine 5'-phosphate oxidase family protein n=1 Tax=Streptomyces lancefieldiae TaxID=3075520 RepID=A0ABU3AUI4_9ACTN|nr:pyridoxamine 5'-phosphate oxidase family protein [Streptomyces sp. DSM 40712]MDT0612763.1 pyridoxamine 5'-phosphate oxidase family protein [Streptomyces sp. DSM 40712]
MSAAEEPAVRTRALLDGARYLNLATVSESGEPWVATLQYAWLGGPLRLVFGSSDGSRHGRDISATPRVSGSLFVAGKGDGLDVGAVDGAQFTGVCTELDGDALDQYHAFFYEALFPDERERARWMLPQTSLRAPADHRLYLVEVERWWLVDTRTWEHDRIDRRREVDLDELTRA